MKKDNEYSGLIDSLRRVFDAHARGDSRYLLVYWQGWGETTAYVDVKPGEWPWVKHDNYMANDNNASILAIAFDLQQSFDEQMPEHMRQFQTLEGFAFKPLIHIPDRAGVIPAKRQREELAKALRPHPHLRLLK